MKFLLLALFLVSCGSISKKENLTEEEREKIEKPHFIDRI